MRFFFQNKNCFYSKFSSQIQIFFFLKIQKLFLKTIFKNYFLKQLSKIAIKQTVIAPKVPLLSLFLLYSFLIIIQNIVPHFKGLFQRTTSWRKWVGPTIKDLWQSGILKELSRSLRSKFLENMSSTFTLSQFGGTCISKPI